MLFRATRWTGLATGLCAASCGGRTGLLETSRDHPVTTLTARPPTSSKPPEPPPPDHTPEPVKPCAAGMCPDDGDACNGVERCDPRTNGCYRTEAPSCDDGLVCNGIETCDPKRGCVSGASVVCDAPGASCDENTGRCACKPPFLLPDCKVKTALFARLGQVRDLAEERGVLWVTTTTGLWVLDFAGTPAFSGDDTWVHYDELLGASDRGKLVIDRQGTKWFGGTYERELVRFDDGGTPLARDDDAWHFYHAPSAFSPNGFGIDATGSAWLGQWGETQTFSDASTPDDRSDDAWRAVSALGAPARLIGASSIEAIASDALGRVWLGASTGEVFAYDTGTRQFADLSDGSWSRIDGLSRVGDTLWVSGSQGGTTLAAVPVPGSVASVSMAQATLHPAPHAVETFDVDASGHVWVSDDASSFSCLDLGLDTWTAWSLGGAVSSIRARSPTELWLGGDSVFHLDHGGSCAERTDRITELFPQQTLRAPARDLAIEGRGVWLATDHGVDYLDTGGTPLDRADDRWAHFEPTDVSGLEDLQGVVVGPNGLKYFWGQTGVFAFDDGRTPWDPSDDHWVGHETGPLWVSGVVDAENRLLVVARTNDEPTGTARVVVFDLAGTPADGSDDVVTTIDSGQPGIGRNMTIDTQGELWLATESEQQGGNLFHWDRRGTPLDGTDDVWTPVRSEDGRVWKLEADPTGGIWGTVAGGVFQFYDAGTPADLSDDYWHLYPELGSAMDIGPDGIGWFRMPGGVGILDVGATPREPSDDVAEVLLSPDALRFSSDLYTNGVIDDQGRFWVVADYLQVFEWVH